MPEPAPDAPPRFVGQSVTGKQTLSFVGDVELRGVRRSRGLIQITRRGRSNDKVPTTDLNWSLYGFTSQRMRPSLKCSLGVAVCAATAVVLCVFLNDSADLRLVAPAVCLQVVIVASLHWGRLSGLVGAVLSGLIMGVFLFPPIGSLAIHDAMERLMLTGFVAGSLFVALIVPRDSRRELATRTRTLRAAAGVLFRPLKRLRDSE